MHNNSTEGNCTVQDDFKYMLYSSAFSIVFILGIIFNMVALYIFTCTLKQRNETTTYMLNLTVCDMLFVLSLPFRISYYLNKSWPFGPALCKITVALFYMNMYGSILFLTCISADRFLAIVYPFASRSLRTRRNAKIACCSVWVLLLSVSLSAGLQLETSRGGNSSNCFDNFSNSQWQSTLSKVVLVMETVGFVIPLLINLFCSMMILRTLRNLDMVKGEGQLNKTKILHMICVHLLCFCFCFIPYNINLVFYTLVRSKTITNCAVETIVRTINPIALCIAVTNCCFDPVIYYFTSETIQNCIKHKSYSAQGTRKQCDEQDDKPAVNTARFLISKLILTESALWGNRGFNYKHRNTKPYVSSVCFNTKTCTRTFICLVCMRCKLVFSLHVNMIIIANQIKGFYLFIISQKLNNWAGVPGCSTFAKTYCITVNTCIYMQY